MRVRGLWCVFLAALAVWGAGTASLAAQPCDLAFTPVAAPSFTPSMLYIGYDGSGYARTDLLAPEPIPLGFSGSDEDRVHVYCGGNCHPFGVPGAWTADWSLSTANGVSPGSFMDALANLVPVIADASSVLYLPPGDMAPGSSREILVHARLVDVCAVQGFADGPGEVRFRVTVARIADGQYSVTAILDSIDIPMEPIPPCPSTQTVCELIIQFDFWQPPGVSITAFPSAGMVLGEVRMLQAQGEDIDRLQAECGTPPGYEPPVSNFGEQEYCDRLAYAWSVVAGPGSGMFFAQGRSALFRATKKGNVTVQVRVTGSDGESAVAQQTFMIHKPRVDRLAYAGGHAIARDLDGFNYGPPEGPHWKDENDDGDAADPGDWRISAAYTRQGIVEVRRVYVDCGTKAPPAAILLGVGPGWQMFQGGICQDPDAAPAELAGCELRASLELPDKVKKYEPYVIGWFVSFGDDYFVLAGTTDTWLYVTLNDPATSYPKYESVYDISCKAAAGSSDAGAVGEAIRAKFASRELHRKARDGFNVEDGRLLRYWAVPDPPAGLAGLLRDPDGNGQCAGFAQLFKACHEVQGLSGGTVYELQYPPGAILGTELLVKEWTVVGGSPPRFRIGTEIVEAPGIPAQGNADPASRFIRHYIVRIGADYYDPSYGTGPFADENAHEDAAMAAFSLDGIFAELNRLNELELEYQPTGYLW